MTRQLFRPALVIFICSCRMSRHSSPEGPDSDTTLGGGTFDSTVAASYGAFPYDLGKSAARYAMPAELREISGIAWYRDAQLVCVQDEDAVIYLFDPGRGDVVWKRDFGSPGDYEDIALAGDTAWIIRSDGRLFEIKDFREGDLTVREYRTALSARDNTEGLCYDSLTRSLLIACKASPVIGGSSLAGSRAVFRFGLPAGEPDGRPYLVIDTGRLTDPGQPGFFERISIAVIETLGLARDRAFFNPSGIAVHPLKDEIYMISAVRGMLIVADRQGTVRHVRRLDSGTFRQAEGICFSPGGDLYIASEGRGGEGYVLVFEPAKNR